MKKTWAGGFLALLGTIWSVAIICIAGNNLPDSWYTNLGKFWSNVVDLKLMPLFVITTLITVLGLILVLIDLFRKEK